MEADGSSISLPFSKATGQNSTMAEEPPLKKLQRAQPTFQILTRLAAF